MPLKAQIPLQDKIAELERRIEKLEKEELRVWRVERKVRGEKPVYDEHWRKMWEEFHLAIREVFK